MGNRNENEAYLASIPGEQYAVFFTDGGSVTLDLSKEEEPFRLRWLDISRSEWKEGYDLPGSESADLTAPGSGQWIAFLVTDN